MNNKHLNPSNRKNAGNGNGNSIINSNNSAKNANNYASGDFPSSAGHKFSKNTQNNAEQTK